MNRTWVYAPSRTILESRWGTLLAEQDIERRAALFKTTRDSAPDRSKEPLPGELPIIGSLQSVPAGTPPPVVRIGYRSFDRQWVISDARALDQPRPDLWAARVPDQVFIVEQHSKPITNGPGLVFSSLIPDMDHFNNRGGRVLALLHADGSANLPDGLTRALSQALGRDVIARDVLAYIAGVVSHPAYTQTFVDELTTPGVRVPLTSDRALWARAVALGEQVVWLQTYGEAFASDEAQRPRGSVRYPVGDPRQPLARTPVGAMPAVMIYDEADRTLRLGEGPEAGTFGPVVPEVWDYAVGGRHVLKSWFNYR